MYDSPGAISAAGSAGGGAGPMSGTLTRTCSSLRTEREAAEDGAPSEPWGRGGGEKARDLGFGFRRVTGTAGNVNRESEAS